LIPAVLDAAVHPGEIDIRDDPESVAKLFKIMLLRRRPGFRQSQ
jgi:hypothetical protein